MTVLEFTTLNPGCGTGGAFTSTPPAADMSICTGDSITLTYSASDFCTNDSVEEFQVTFAVNNWTSTDAAAISTSGSSGVNIDFNATVQAGPVTISI